jgi:hypothetical protein
MRLYGQCPQGRQTNVRGKVIQLKSSDQDRTGPILADAKNREHPVQSHGEWEYIDRMGLLYNSDSYYLSHHRNSTLKYLYLN